MVVHGTSDGGGAEAARIRAAAVFFRRAVPFVLAILACACASATAGKAAPERDQPEVQTTRYPATVAEAVSLSLARMGALERTQLAAMRREDVKGLLHGFQMTARHDFGLTNGNPQLLRSCGSETMVLEDCLAVILDAVWLALNKANRIFAVAASP